MCAIWGISMLNGATLTDNEVLGRLVSRLILNSQKRGRDASGIAIISRSKVVILKRDVAANTFVSINAFREAIEKYCDIATTSDLNPITIIGHCRAKTKGPEKIYENNHPIRSGDIVGIHNGMISNDDNLFRHWSKKHTCMKRAGTVDSEVIFSLLNMYLTYDRMNVRTAISKTASELVGSMACAFIDINHPYSLYLFRNNNPTDILLYGDKGILFFASKEEYIKSTVSGFVFGEPTTIKYEHDSMIHIDLFKNRINSNKILKNDTKCKMLQLPGVGIHQRQAT